MEVLRKILRLALSLKADQIRLLSGMVPDFIDSTLKQTPLTEIGAISAEDLVKLFDFLFPAEKNSQSKDSLCRGILNIPNVGKIHILGQRAPTKALSLYLPPRGESLCEKDWSKSNHSRGILHLDLFSSIKSPDTKADPLQIIPSEMNEIPGLLFTPKIAAKDPPASDETSTLPTSIPSGLGFIPVGIDALQNAAQPPIIPPMSVSPKIIAGSPGFVPNFAPLSEEPNQKVSSPQLRKTLDQSPEVHSIEETGTIDFGPDADGMSGKSFGDNSIDPILKEMVSRKASDLHMTCNEPYYFRIDGDIEKVGNSPLTPEDLQNLLLPIIPKTNLKEFIAKNDTDFAYEIADVGRFRVNIFRDRNGVGAVMRHIPSKILTAEQLNLSHAIIKFCQLNKGLVLVTGPTGSGKSTTLAAMIDHINKTRADHILTIEDPVEFIHPQQRCLVNQREVHKHTSSFSRALKAALREDPDIILIGEMRDLETIAIAIETAETGHLVFGTLHTTTAVSTIDRIIDQFPSDRQAQIRMMLSSSLKGVVAQTLLKKKSGGRVAAHEILVTNDAVSAMIREGKNHMIANHMQSQKMDGNQLLNDSLLKLVKEGLVEAEEAYRKSVDKAAFQEGLKRSNLAIQGTPPPTARPPTPARSA